MRALVAAVVLASAGCGASGTPRSDAAAAGGAEPLTVERIVDGPSVTGSSPSAPQWSPDGARLAFLWGGSEGQQREVWLVEADGEGLRRLTGAVERSGGVRAFAWMPDGRTLVHLRGGVVARTDLDGSSGVLTTDAGGASSLRVSPDSRHVSFLDGGDLWLLALATGELTRRTDVAVPSISSIALGRYSRRDVEIGTYVWGGPTYAWSPDGGTIAFHHVDRRHLPVVHFPDYLAAETEPNPVRRGYPGDPNEARRVGLLDVDTGEMELLDLPGPTENRVVDFSWSPDGRLLIDRDSDTAEERWLHVWEPETRELRELWRDRRETRVYTAAGSAWHPDGEHVLFLGDLDDRYGLYMVGGELEAPRRLSNPEFDVTSAPGVGGDRIVFESNEPSPYETHVYVAGAAGGRRITTLAGQNRAYPSPDGEHVAVLHSDDLSPPELYLVDMDGGAAERRVTRSTPRDFDQREWARARYVTFPSHVDGVTLHARILEPARIEAGRRYPVLFGPVYSNTVRNRWGGRYALIQQLLVERGYIVVQVDVRGSTGYGRAFREGFLMDFAGQDLEDLESAVRHVRGLPHVDPDRIGVWGSSYGGTLTVYALLKKPGLFQAGVAAAAAVDPRFFGGDDVAIVRRPGSHPQAFLRGAAQYAANLEDPLLFIHGMQDQIVPFKTTVALADELMRQGKDFDFAFAPRATHGWTGRSHQARYLLGKLIGHFDRHLAPAAGEDR